MAASAEGEAEHITIDFKYKRETFTQTFHPATSVLAIKTEVFKQTNIRPGRMKLVGLRHGEEKRAAEDEDLLNELVFKAGKGRVMVNGTPEAAVFVDPTDLDNLPDVVDDLDLDYFPEDSDAAGLKDNPVVAKRLEEAIERTEIRMLNPPRDGKKLLVLDLDYTLFDHKAIGASHIDEIKRPHLVEFLTLCYVHYDIVVWSQTKWTYLEMKLTELGLLTHADFKLMFVLDISAMFTVTSIQKGRERTHQVKALDVIWALTDGRYGPDTTVHVDDVSRNFALNPRQGIKIRAFKSKRASASTDRELFLLAAYLLHYADADFHDVDHSSWRSTAKRIIDDASRASE